MNKYQNALERLSKIDLNMVLDELGYERSQMISDYGMNDYPNIEMYGDICVLKELVEKETPDKWNEYFEEIICPICGQHWNVIDNCTETFKYCPNCGKKLY